MTDGHYLKGNRVVPALSEFKIQHFPTETFIAKNALLKASCHLIYPTSPYMSRYSKKYGLCFFNIKRL